MISKASFTCLLLASSAIAYAQDQAPPEPSPSEAASEHEPPKSQPAAAAATATDSKAPKWDVEQPRGLTTRKVPIDTDEGTWMNVDVTPDGSRIAFDLLGDIYAMPIAGGTPTRIAEGLAYEQQPRFSPDGTPHRLHLRPRRRRQYLDHERRRLEQAPADQGRLPPAQPAELEPRRPLHRRQEAFHHRRARSAPARSGSTTSTAAAACSWSSGRTRSTRRSSASRPSRPTASTSTSPATSRPAAPSNMRRTRTPTLFAIERYELETGETHRGHRRQWRRGPPDALARRQVARLRPPRARQVEALRPGPRHAATSARSTTRSTRTCRRPGRSPASIRTWTGPPDSREVVFWAGGKIRRVDADGGGARGDPVPGQRRPRRRRRARTRRSMSRRTASRPRCSRWAQRLAGRPRRSSSKRSASCGSSPSAGGAPRRLTAATRASFELFPSLVARRRARSPSSAGPTRGSGEIQHGRAQAAERRATSPASPAIIARPRFSPDGRTIVFERRAAAT